MQSTLLLDSVQILNVSSPTLLDSPLPYALSVYPSHFSHSVNLFLTNSTLNMNGGALYTESSNVTMFNCFISNNSATNGGGMYIANSNVRVENSVFNGNFATFLSNPFVASDDVAYPYLRGGNGGGIYVESSSLSLINSVVANNLAHSGGGLFVLGCNPANPSGILSSPFFLFIYV